MQERPSIRLPDLVIISLLAATFFLWNIDSPSFWRGDESIRVLTAQDTYRSGALWYPTWIPDGEQRPYWNKPPLRIWVGIATIAILGESNFTHRLPDALAGFGILILTFLFAMRIFRSRLVGYVALCSLLGSSSFLFLHGPRHASLDMLLLFFQLLALYCGWRIVERSFSCDERVPDSLTTAEPISRWAIIGGLALGLAIMTKSAAGVIPLGLMLIAILVSGRTLRVFRATWKSIAAVVLIALTIGIPYFAFHCSFTFGACFPLVYEDIFVRSTRGYVNRDAWWLYLSEFFVARSLTQPELTAIGLGFALFVTIKSNALGMRFLIVCALTPLIVFSIMPSRLLWYMYLALPSFALLIGFFIERLIQSAKGVRGLRRAVVTAAIFISLLALMMPMGSALKRISAPASRIQLDRFVHSLREELPDSQLIGFMVELRFPRNEAAYKGMLRDQFVYADSPKALKEMLTDSSARFVVAHLTKARRLLATLKVQGYLIIRPVDGRQRWLVVFDRGPGPLLPNFSPVTQEVDIALLPKESLLYGWSSPLSGDGIQWRNIVGDSAALLVPGDGLLLRKGVALEIAMAGEPGEHIKLRVNESFLGELVIDSHGFKTYTVQVPSQVVQSGRNVLFISSSLRNSLPSSPPQPTAPLLADLRLSFLKTHLPTGP